MFVLLVEFGDAQYPNPIFQGPPPDGSTTDVTGPLHNEIPAPDRSVDNSTLWQADYDVAHYQDMYFTRMAKYYETQSSNRYSVKGDVNGWVKVPFNEALYGRNYCGGIVCNTSQALVRDAMAVWVKQQIDLGKTTAQIADYLKTFDVWDRYDLNGNGNFNEPDGYIDHMQIVHAGGDEAAGDPNQGTDAIWSHRWYSALQAGGPGGLPGVNVGDNGGLVSSALVPDNPTGVWLGDYTVQPENGGLGVFAHEYGHDLGLPDLYDTSGNTGGAENSTAFWTLMSSGANIGDGSPDGIGDAPTDLGAWERFQLGWLNAAGRQRTVLRGGLGRLEVDPQARPEHAGHQVAAGGVHRPAGQGGSSEPRRPCRGRQVLLVHQGRRPEHDDDLADRLGHEPDRQGALRHRDRLRLRVPRGHDRRLRRGCRSRRTARTPPVTRAGSTGARPASPVLSTAWVDLTATLPAGTQKIRFRYQTDGGLARPGFQVDAISVGGTAVPEAGWTLAGFILTTGSESQSFFNAYVLENRQYDGYDASLRTAYNFGFLNTRPDWVETYPYQNGLLVSYWDESQTDNNVGDHPGAGLILPVDAHPTFPTGPTVT